MSSKKIDKVIQVESIADLNSFNLTNYINFVRRSGGQMLQHYSLLDSYSEYLGYGSNSASGSGYRETEVSFSREVYKKRVLSSVVLPLYSEDFSSNDFSMNTSLTSTGAERNFFQLQLIPSWYDRHLNNFEMSDGELRNVYKRATQSQESFLNTDVKMLGGEFRLPLLRYNNGLPDSVGTGGIILSGGELRKILIRASTRVEEVESKEIRFLSLATSTNRKYDLAELDFDSISSLESSPKTDSRVLDDFSTVEDSLEFVKTSDTDIERSIRILNKKGGIKTSIPSESVEVYNLTSWTLSVHGLPRELSPGSYLLYLPGILSVRLDSADPSKLSISVSSVLNIKTESGTVSLNKWFNISIESLDGIIHAFVDGKLVGKANVLLPNDLRLFQKDSSIYVGNDSSRTNGFIGNVDKLSIIKSLAQNASKNPEDPPVELVREVLASELSLSPEGDVGDLVEGVNWVYASKPGYNPVTKGLVFAAAQYLTVSNVADLSIYNFNNYKIELEFYANTLPSLNYPLRTLLHKTGEAGGGNSSHLSGYHLSLVSVDDTVKLIFRLANVTLTSSRNILIKTPYKVEIFKYSKYLMMFINDVFENLVNFDNTLQEDPLSDLLIGRFRTIPSYDFQGEIYSWKFTNYYLDKNSDPEKNDLLKRYLPENNSNTVVLNFERDLFDEGDPRRDWVFGDNLVSEENYLNRVNPKFGEVSLSLNTTANFIYLRRDPVFDLKKEDFTLEVWMYLKEDNTYSTIISNGVTANSLNSTMYRGLIIDSLGKVVFEASKEGTGLPSDIVLKSTSRVPLNVWTHIVLVREGADLSIYLQGVKNATVIIPTLFVDFSVENTLLGSSYWRPATESQLTGNMDSFRLTKSKALYSGNSFPVPTKPFGNIDTGRIMDLTFDKSIATPPLKEILLNFDKTPQPEFIKAGIINSKSLNEKLPLSYSYLTLDIRDTPKLIGSSTTTSTTTYNPTTKYSSISKFGSRSFEGIAGGGIKLSSSFFNFGLEDFSIDMWTYRYEDPAPRDAELLFGSAVNISNWGGRVNSADRFYICLKTYSDTGYRFWWDSDSSKRQKNTWNHIVFSRTAGVFKLFLNGKLEATLDTLKTFSYDFNSGGAVSVGQGAWSTGSEHPSELIAGFRVIRGLHPFNSDFNAANLKDPVISSEGGITSESNRLAYLYNPTEVFENFTTKLFGSSSISFTGLSGLKTVRGDSFFSEDILINRLDPIVETISPSDDFTLEFDIRFEENYSSKFQTILATTALDSKFFSFYRFGNHVDIPVALRNKVAMTILKDNYFTPIIISDTELEDNQWYNITLTRYQGVLKLFLNGMLNTQVLNTNLSLNFESNSALIGSGLEDFSTVKGNIESLRLTPGISLYKNSFQTPNVYFSEESSEFFNLNYLDNKVKDEASKAFFPDLQVGDSSIVSEDGREFLRTNLASTKTYKGTYIPSGHSVLNLGLGDFTIEYSFRVSVDKSFNAFQRSTSSPTYFSQITDSYSRPTLKNAVTFESSNSSISLKTPPESYSLGNWYVVTITRTSGIFNLYLDGIIKDTKQVQETINLGTSDFYIAGGSSSTEMDIDYLYINKGTAIYPTIPPQRPTINREGFSERLEIITSSVYDLIPENCYFENASLDQVNFVTLTDSEKVLNLSARFEGNSYLKMDNFPAIPRAFVLDFWFLPDKISSRVEDISLLKVSQSLEDLNKGLTINILPDNYLYVGIKSDNLAEAAVTSNRKILENEWNSVRLIFKDGLLDIYMNGSLVGYYQHNNPTFFEGTLGTLYMGFDPTAESSLPYKGYIDNLNFYKYTLKIPSGYTYYSTLQSLFKDYNKEVYPLKLENGEIPNNLIGWKVSQGSVHIEAVEALENSKVFRGDLGGMGSKMEQEIDLSSYSNEKDLEIYTSWTQIKNSSENSFGGGRVYLEYYDKFKNKLSKLESENLALTSNRDYVETERLLIGSIPSHCKYIKVHVELLGDTGIRNIQIYTKDLGIKYYDRTRDVKEVYAPLEELPRTVASRYFSYNSVYEDYNKEDLVSSIEIKDLQFKDPDNLIYSNISVEDVKSSYEGYGNIILRKNIEG